MDGHDARTLAGADAERLATARCVVLPLGSVEYHGPHAPLGTDTTLADGFARRLAERVDGVALPAIPFAVLPSTTAGRPGSLGVGAGAYLGYLTEVLRALLRQDVTRVLALNAHSENQHAARLAAETVVGERPEASVAVANWWRFVPEGAGAALGFSDASGHGHGGPLEISVTAAFDPSGVDARFGRDIAFEAPWWRGAAQVVGLGQAPLGWEGYHGRVSQLSSASGATLAATALDGLTRFVDDWLVRAAESSHDGRGSTD
jgi:creatinine amidohydrolase